MFPGSLHRVILLDLFKIFTISLVALTCLILMAGVISEAMKNGLGPAQILVAIPLLLPSMLPYTVPTTTLFSTCIVYGRLAADHEILALKAAGVHIFHVIWPALVLGACASGATLFLSLDVIPYTHFLLRSELAGDVEDLLYAILRKDGCFRHPKVNYEIYVKNQQGRQLYNVQIMRRSPSGIGFDLIARAREAELRVDLDNKQILFDLKKCHVVEDNGTVGFLDSGTWPIQLPPDFAGGCVKARATDMTWAELADYAMTSELEKQKISREIDLHQTAIRLGSAPGYFADHVRNKINERKYLETQIFQIKSEPHMRAGFALGCLCFALVGCPIGIWFSRSDYLSAFITCFLPIVTIYYPLMFCMINMARSGKVPPALVIYNADALLLLAGCLLFRRLARF